MKIAILGAGISGMALARFLVEGGHALSDIHLFEASSVPGGLCRSKTVDGFTYDVAGGHILFSKDAAAMQWMKDCSGGDEAFHKRDRNTKIRFGSEWVQYPFENGLGDLPPQASFECVAGYVHAWHERKASGSEAPKDFKNWIRWRFGAGIADHFMDPYNEKIWKRDLTEVTSDWVAGRVPDAPIEDVLKSVTGIRTEGYSHQAIFYYPKSGGFQGITEGVGSTLSSQIRLSTPVTDVQCRGEGYTVNGEDFDQVVCTLPLDIVPKLLKGVPADVAQAMEGLSHNGLTSVLLALDRPEHPNLSWVYLPHHSQGPANRITYMSNYATSNAPAGKSSFLCEVTSPGGHEPDAGALIDEVVSGMQSAGLVDRSEILFTDSTYVPRAYVVFDHEYKARRKAAMDYLDSVGITPLGRFGRYEYDNSDQCVIKARELAQRMLNGS